MPDAQIPTSVLLRDANAFAAKNPNARFAILRVWSAPHFYPLEVKDTSRSENSFFDTQDRIFAWRFLAKDKALSEWDMHKAIGIGVEPYMCRLKKYVKHRRDLFLVMAEDEDRLQTIASAVTFAVQTKPWLLEIDLWKSFVNIDLEFLNGLDPKWLD